MVEAIVASADCPRCEKMGSVVPIAIANFGTFLAKCEDCGEEWSAQLQLDLKRVLGHPSVRGDD